MSYILEALKKAEQSRTLGHVPGITAEHEYRPHARRGLRWPWLLTLVLAANGALLAALMWRGGVPAPADATVSVQPAPDMTVQPSSPPDVQASPAPAVPAAAAQEPAMQIPQVSYSRPAPAAVEVSASEPRWEDLPERLPLELPSLSLDVHVYSESPVQRFVLINLRRYREGERLQEGPLLERITPEGVVVLHGGTRYAVPRQ